VVGEASSVQQCFHQNLRYVRMEAVVDVGNAEDNDADADDDDDDDDDDENGSGRRRSKKSKVASKFQLDAAVSKLVKLDEQNHKLWDDVLPFIEEGQQVILMLSVC